MKKSIPFPQKSKNYNPWRLTELLTQEIIGSFYLGEDIRYLHKYVLIRSYKFDAADKKQK